MSYVTDSSIINTDIRFSIVENNSFLGAGLIITDLILRNDDQSDTKLNSMMVKVLVGKGIVNSGYYVLGLAFESL